VCLGIPGQVVERVEGYGDQLALVDVVGGRQRVNVGMLEDDMLEPGDWVLIHMGFALEKIDEAAAEQALAGLELMGRPRAAAPGDDALRNDVPRNDVPRNHAPGDGR
jgi:hydrogenase expression/formation protein HypC